MTPRVRWVAALALALGPVAWAGPSCQVERSADALHRLEVWGRELAGAKGRIAAYSARRVVWVADRRGTVLEALFLVAVQEAGAPVQPGASLNRSQWVRCTGGGGDARGKTDLWH